VVTAAPTPETGWSVLRTVPDPEIPVLSLVDLGVIRELEVEAGIVKVGITPTYSGCPATAVIKSDVQAALELAGMTASVYDVLSPPWTTAWITPEGCEKLRQYGIAPPQSATETPSCPLCGSLHTELLSEFGSTPCKSLHRCCACLEPFDRFKCI
jgi:ring-1,2-phenylacetyl-CoA epoxidase subunit PaaD